MSKHNSWPGPEDKKKKMQRHIVYLLSNGQIRNVHQGGCAGWLSFKNETKKRKVKRAVNLAKIVAKVEDSISASIHNSA